MLLPLLNCQKSVVGLRGGGRRRKRVTLEGYNPYTVQHPKEILEGPASGKGCIGGYDMGDLR